MIDCVKSGLSISELAEQRDQKGLRSVDVVFCAVMYVGVGSPVRITLYIEHLPWPERVVDISVFTLCSPGVVWNFADGIASQGQCNNGTASGNLDLIRVTIITVGQLPRLRFAVLSNESEIFKVKHKASLTSRILVEGAVEGSRGGGRLYEMFEQAVDVEGRICNVMNRSEENWTRLSYYCNTSDCTAVLSIR